MLIRHIRTSLLALVGLLMLTATSRAQHRLPLVDIEPGSFHTDYQYFSPLQSNDFVSGFIPNNGWFFAYDKTHLFVTRPEAEESSRQSDRTWGSRYDFGYMTHEDHGWYFSVMTIDGPHKSNTIRQERNNRYVEGSPADEPIDPPQDNNNRITGARDYFLFDSLNVGKFSNFEVNKTFRWQADANGRVVEPFIGFRYARFVDFFKGDEYNRYDEDGVPVPLIPDPNDPNSPAPDDAEFEELISDRTAFTNNMVGGQLGARWYNKRGRWLISTELKLFIMGNFQNYHQNRQTVTTQVEVGTENEVDTERVERLDTYAYETEFVVGGELRVEAAYELTRDFSLRFGFEFLDFGRGIGRGNFISANDEDLQAFGFTFGATLNR